MRTILLALLITACGDNEPPLPFPTPGVDAGVDAASNVCCTAFIPPLSCYPPPGECYTYACGTVCTSPKDGGS